jgi:flagellar motor switch protein FliM
MSVTDEDTSAAPDEEAGPQAADAPADEMPSVLDGAPGFDESLLPEDDDALGQSEIDDLFGISMEDEEETTGFTALINSSHIQHNRLPLLEACFDRLVRSLTGALRNFTAENVELSLAETSSTRFGNYIEAIPLPALISVFEAVEWHDHGLIVIDSPLIYSIIDVLLGGRRASTSMAIEGRSFTTIESTLIERMIKLILKEMSIAFKPMSEVEFRHERLESNPSLASIAYPTNTAVLFKIDVDMDDRGGQIQILFPHATLEPVRNLLQQMFMGEKFGQDAIWETHWAREMLMSDTELEVSLGEQMVSLNEIMGLKVGSTLELRTRPNDLVTLRSGNIPLLRGRVGRISDKVAIKVEDWIGERPDRRKTARSD